MDDSVEMLNGFEEGSVGNSTTANYTDGSDDESGGEKTIIEFEPCDKKATLYVMERKESGITK